MGGERQQEWERRNRWRKISGRRRRGRRTETRTKGELLSVGIEGLERKGRGRYLSGGIDMEGGLKKKKKELRGRNDNEKKKV